ncbi:MAG: transcription-repair coupling factor [Ruminococcaceae bacterium]|nr:transcription-repair coupling factor [Oscillospiraceae bacterium]
MNYHLLTEMFRRNRDYGGLISHLTSPAFGKRNPAAVYGLTDSAEYVMLTAMAEDMRGDDVPVTIVFPEEKRARNYSDFLKSHGIGSMVYPARDYNFNNMTASHDYEHERLSVLSSLYGISTGEYEVYDKPDVICTTAEAMLQITMPPSMLSAHTIRVSADETLDSEKFAAELVAAGYVKVDLVEGMGQFAKRGGIFDVYPTNGQPVRIELFGDEIDRIGYFSPETQRFTESAPDELAIPPARELIAEAEVKEELGELLRRQIRRLGKTENADERYARAITLLTGELASLEHGIELNSLDKYIPMLYPDGDCYLDYTEGVIIVVDSAAAEEKAVGALALVNQSLTDMTENFELPPVRANYGYMREWESLEDAFDSGANGGVFIDSLKRNHHNVKDDGVFSFTMRHVSAYSGNTELFLDDLKNYTADDILPVVLFATEAEQKNVSELLIAAGYTVAPCDGDNGAEMALSLLDSGKRVVLTMVGEFLGGYEMTMPKFVLMDYSASQVKLSRMLSSRIKKGKKIKKSATEAIMSYADLEVGDLVVHAAYGIGQYMGLENMVIDGSSRDYVHIKYAGTDKLFLPVDQLDLVSKYIGAGSDTGMVKLSKMGGADWTRSKTKAKTAAKEMAKELIELYAKRKRTKGISHDPDDEMCREFADAFEYEETDGQLAAIEDVRRDMEAACPMDRLLCGDVGYGKTEVALRAAFKAAAGGHQVAILVPTTILAYQHYRNFLSRMRAFPVKIDMVSRFRTQSEQQASLRKLRRGDTDIIIGTHRLLSKDVEFKNLGLIIVDEEQRFGVAQKEKLKQIATNADILTLTATPIPRTLNMAMGGIVDMSVLEEAPGQRSPVQTYVLEFDEVIINEAIRRELRRNGQVFYLYNRVEGIYNVANRIAKAHPDAKIAVAHGKMEREEIEEVWEAIIKGEADILVCTTIIETGVDVPNANTLIIENADTYGLSQLHQIRGRVGRSSRRAFAYFTYRQNKALSEIAEKRLEAIREYAAFGAGFKIALRDLEIRGAGNLLGAEQHGHMEAVGYDLYMKLLSEAVVEEKGDMVPPKPECAVDIRCDAFLSKSYIPKAPQRMDMYKKIARIENEEDYDDLIDELCDRYGEPNSSALNLCRVALIKAYGGRCGIRKVEEKDGVIRLYQDNLNPKAAQSLAVKYPMCQLKVMLGQAPHLVMKMKKGERNTDFIIEILKYFLSVTEGCF